MFSGALFLLALIIFNTQGIDYDEQQANVQNTDTIELAAEIFSSRTAPTILPIRQLPGVINASISGDLRHLEYKNPTQAQIQLKMQKEIYFGLKPLINYQYGQSLHHRS